MTIETHSKSCLLIIPRHFYSFEKLFTENLEARGFQVTVSNDEYPSGTVGKIMGKLRIPLIFPITAKHIEAHYLAGKHYDLILIFKGRGLSRALIRKMRSHADRVIAYNWDSFKYNNTPLSWLNEVTRYYTFDYRDADNHQLPVVELFSSINAGSAAGNSPSPDKNIPLSAIFRNHSGRLKYLDKVLSALDLKTDDIALYIFEQNIFFRILNFARHPLLYLKYRKHMSSRSLPYADYIDVLQRSEYTVDYAHPAQSGLTMRSFEALSTNTKFITNNRFIDRSKYFNEGNAILFPENAPLHELREKFKAHQGSTHNQDIRTLDTFIGDLLRE